MPEAKGPKVYAFLSDGEVQSIAALDEAPEGWVEATKEMIEKAKAAEAEAQE